MLQDMKLLRVVVLAGLAFFIGASALHAQTVGGWGYRLYDSSRSPFSSMMPCGMQVSGWTGLGFMGMLLMLAWWIFIVGCIAFFLRWMMRGGVEKGTEERHTALDILKERYARGEINKAEYEEKLKDLS